MSLTLRQNNFEPNASTLDSQFSQLYLGGSPSSASAADGGASSSSFHQSQLLHHHHQHHLHSHPYHISPGEALLTAVFSNDADTVRALLVDDLASVDTYDNRTRTSALQWAVQRQFMRVVQVLLDFSPSLDHRDLSGNTALHYACGGDRREDTAALVECLLRAGATPNSPNVDGATPLHFVAANLAPVAADLVKLLVAFGAHTIDCADDEGDSPLHWAVRESNDAVLEQLLAHGASTRSVNSELETPLHLAACLNHLSAAKLLLGASAPLDLVDCDGSTPVQIAGEAGFKPLLHLMLRAASAGLDDESQQ